MNVAGMNMLSLPHLRNVISSHTENGSPRGARSLMSQCVPPGLRQRECRFPSSLGLRGTWVIKMCLQKKQGAFNEVSNTRAVGNEKNITK